MNRVYSKDNKKDKFIIEHFLPYLMQYIEESDYPAEVAKAVASMYIFPYIADNGKIYIGSLKEPGISWYFAPQDDKQTFSSGSYRIFAENIMKPEQFKKFRQIFLGNNLISDFTNAAVIKDLLDRMSKETEYSELWWSCAYDIYRLWTPVTFSIQLSEATRSMSNNSFLFNPEYKGYTIKDELIEHRIFKDILTSDASNIFWDKISQDERKRALTVLKNLGVPCSFISESLEWSIWGMQGVKHVNPYILRFVAAIGNDIVFPVKEGNEKAALCRLSHDLFMNVIYNESKEAFLDASDPYDEDTYNAGILVINVEGAFVPLSWHLFYSADDFEKATEDKKFDIGVQHSQCQSLAFEYLHIDVERYDPGFIKDYANFHEFSKVHETADKYKIKREETASFYKWVWHYSRHAELAYNILCYYSGNELQRKTVVEEDIEFIMSVIDFYDAEGSDENDFCFNIDLNEDEAFTHAETVNKIHRSLPNIYAVVHGEFKKLDVTNYIKRILDSTESNYSVKSNIESDEIWNHVYIIAGEPGKYDGTYLRCKIFDENKRDNLENAIVLWPSDNENSYIRAIAEYVHQCYEVEVSVSSAVAFDWRNEYLRMIRDIRSFLSDTHEINSIDATFGENAKMDDVEDFGTEKRIWKRLMERREKIISQQTGDFPVDLNGWKEFLSAKYYGRCQLCGGKISMSEQKPYFWTFRMVKEHDNKLANIRSNLFCLCPSCHGEMQYGSYMGKDMSDVIEKAKRYAVYIEETLSSEEFEDNFSPLIQELAEDNSIEIEGFHNPIVCDVVINGKHRHMAFSWEHFMRIAFIFAKINNYDEDEINEPDDFGFEDEDYLRSISEPEREVHGTHEYIPWHGTEYVTGHWRNRNGQVEWVSGHWRTR